MSEGPIYPDPADGTRQRPDFDTPTGPGTDRRGGSRDTGPSRETESSPYSVFSSDQHMEGRAGPGGDPTVLKLSRVLQVQKELLKSWMCLPYKHRFFVLGVYKLFTIEGLKVEDFPKKTVDLSFPKVL